MAALASLPVQHRVLLTDHASGETLRPIAEPQGFEVFVGDAENVLLRYCSAVEHYGADVVVRATGDNPLVSSAAAREALQLQAVTGADYAGITETPYGTGVEVIRGQALLDLHRRGTDRYEREHVTPGLYRRPERYHIVTRPVVEQLRLPDMRVTLDTPADYEYIAEIFRELYHDRPIELPELVAYGHRYHRDSA
jgi:spore coat polysaccharide biosynthesis protein SpsF